MITSFIGVIQGGQHKFKETISCLGIYDISVFKGLLKLIAPCFIISGCTSSSTTIPAIQGYGLGFSSEGTVVRKLAVTDEGVFAIPRFSDVAEKATLFGAAAKFNQQKPLFLARSIFLGAAAQAVGGKIENSFQKRRCLYEVAFPTAKFRENVEASVFFNGGGLAEKQTVDDFILSGSPLPNGFIETGNGDQVHRDFAIAEQIKKWEEIEPAVEELKRQQNGQGDKTITIPQKYLLNVHEGSHVFVSFHNWGASLHALNPSVKNTSPRVKENK